MTSKTRLMFARPSLTGLPVRPDQSACSAESMTSCRRLRMPPLKSSSCCAMDQPMVDRRRKLAIICGTYLKMVRSSLTYVRL